MIKNFKYISADWEDEILAIARGAIECAISSAYFGSYGVDFLKRLSHTLANSIVNHDINIKILLSDRFAPTPEKRFEILNQILELPGVEARIYSSEEFFHSKNYIFRTDNEVKAVIGSVNVTASGFFKNIEFASSVVHRVNDPEAIKLISNFEGLWVKSQKTDQFIEVDSMSKQPIFEAGNNVIVTSTRKIGTINKVIKGSRDFSYQVTVDGKTRTFAEKYLELYSDPEDDILENFYQDELGDSSQYKIFQTWFRLSKPLESNLYSYLGSKTIFNPYQFKPLLKFISPNSDERLFIADEVGVGKTIETGIIVTEMLARERLTHSTPILIVCPNSLTQKWAREMKERFFLDFEVLDGKKLSYVLNSAIQDGIFPRKYAFSIVGLQLFRRKEYLDLLNELDSRREAATFDLVVIDEAHHMRNPDTDSNKLGSALSDMAEMMLMLSATPLNLSSDDLYNQMHILNKVAFPDRATFEALYRPVVIINRIRRLLSQNTVEKRSEIVFQFVELASDPLGKIISQHEEIVDFIQRLNKEEILSPEELVRYDRLLVSLNPLSYSFTRTRKREALEHQVHREVLELPVTLSDKELRFQDHALEVIQNYYLSMGRDPQILGFITNTYRRMISSCIPAMKNYLEASIRDNRVFDIPSLSEINEYEDDSEINKTILSPSLKVNFQMLLDELEEICHIDSKYSQFKKMLDKIILNPETPQVIVFSFFVETLEHLKRSLEKDGYSVGIIHGKISQVAKNKEDIDRSQTMDSFEKGKYDILLSSEVGGEGLDFQYCHAIFNYDLPYNPMRIEQRIGRIDRFGQNADKIIVGNMFIKNSVDEEIYDRLYRRINLVEEGIGAFEPIMGKEIADIQTAIISGNLSDEQKDEMSQRLQEAIEAAKAEYEQFEKYRTELLGDDYLVKPINSISKGDFVSPSDAMDLTRTYLLMHENCNFDKLDESRAIIKLSPTIITQLETFSRKPGNEGTFNELKALFDTKSSVKVVFDGQLAETCLDHIFLSPTGYWSRFLTHQLEKEKALYKIFRFSINPSESYILNGEYVVFLFEVRMEGLRTEIEFLGLPVNINTKTVYETSFEKIPRLLAYDSIENPTIESEYIDVYELLEVARDYLDEILEEKRRVASEENRFKIDSRITALTESCEKQVEKLQNSLQRHIEKQSAEGEKPDERFMRLMKGRIDSKKAKHMGKIKELQHRQELSLDYNLEAIVHIKVGEQL
ncbi:helicase-related protein [Methanococcoides methylutens]|uniref:Uncharacterized protein n=1 Tax=Methanococcoides methylutens MM1 TaxID=1434104 RepID=A0A0E3X1L0_METMT|nr:helicase-related protein [Methanococcoides methylutens]AKB85359.1 hypothetical protein MCMEM_1306 [Methanococcoides methylutens MM1]